MVTIAQFFNIEKFLPIVLLEYVPSCRNNRRGKAMPEYKWFYLCFLSLGLHLEGLCFAVSLCCHLSSTKYKENTISHSLEAELSIQHIILLVQNQQCLSQMLSKQWEMKKQLRIRKCWLVFNTWNITRHIHGLCPTNTRKSSGTQEEIFIFLAVTQSALVQTNITPLFLLAVLPTCSFRDELIQYKKTTAHC